MRSACAVFLLLNFCYDKDMIINIFFKNMLKIDKLSKKFGANQAVENIDLEVAPGEIFALIGPNGSGKTTIIKIIAGLLRANSGRVVVDGHDTQEQAVKAKAVIGYIPDEPAIWPAMTGIEFLNFSGALYSVPENERLKRIEELLNLFDLGNIKGGYFEDYSRGNKQKFAIMAALLHKPKLLLIDEPIVGLDPVAAEVAEERFRKFAQAGGTVLLVTHTLSVAQRIADRIGVLREGKVLAVGSYSELCTKAKLSEGVHLNEIYKSLTK